MLALGVPVGVALWLWLYRTKTGMVIRAGVDDRQMTSALGINIQRTFAIAFVVGSALVAVRGHRGRVAGERGLRPGRAMASERPRRGDHRWDGLAVRRRRGIAPVRARVLLLRGLPSGHQRRLLHAVLDHLTFVLLALVLAFRPQGLFGRAE